MSGPILQVRNLCVGVPDGRRILHDVTFDLAPREILGIIGASGAGKTVLARALVNWLEPPLVATAGSVLFEERDLLALRGAAMKAERRRIAYVGANPAGCA